MRELKKYCFLQPIDNWLSIIGDALGLNKGPEDDEEKEEVLSIFRELPKKPPKKDDRYLIYNICKICLENEIDPLRFNQGAWYFASQIAGEEKYLRKLLDEGHSALLNSASRFSSIPGYSIDIEKIKERLKVKRYSRC